MKWKLELGVKLFIEKEQSNKQHLSRKWTGWWQKVVGVIQWILKTLNIASTKMILKAFNH